MNRSLMIYRDDKGPFIRFQRRVFRPDWSRRKDTPENRRVRADLSAGGYDPEYIAPQQWKPYPVGSKVWCTIKSDQTMLVTTGVENPHHPNACLFLNWSDEAAPELPHGRPEVGGTSPWKTIPSLGGSPAPKVADHEFEP